jgi:hypothetical protein
VPSISKGMRQARPPTNPLFLPDSFQREATRLPSAF